MIVFTILQYNLSDKTINAVKSIKENTQVDYRIVIVDNCSTNDALKAIKDIYENDTNIHIIKSNKNLGFANGNNFGIGYAMKKFNPNYVLVLNNDIYVKTPITQSMVDEWEFYNFDVMGPDIYRLDINEHQNPLATVNYNLKWLYSFYFIYNIYRLLNILHLDAILHKLAISVLQIMNKRKIKEIKVQEVQEVCKLHGSFLVFSKNFLDRFKNPFHPSTFMYLEEDFLALRCKRANASVLYYPKLLVHHDHGSTVSKITVNDHLKRKYIFKHNSYSFKQLIKYYKSNEI